MREGVTVGMLGASAVAVWFLLVDAMAGAPFRTLGAIAILAEWLFATLAWWTIITANALATRMMGGYLFLAHRRLVRDFLQAEG